MPRAGKDPAPEIPISCGITLAKHLRHNVSEAIRPLDLPALDTARATLMATEGALRLTTGGLQEARPLACDRALREEVLPIYFPWVGYHRRNGAF